MTPLRNLSAYALDNPGAHLGYQSGLFECGNEFQRTHHAMFRPFPSQEGFHASEPATDEIHLRLIVQDKLIPIERIPQSIYLVEFFDCPRVHFRREKAIGIPARRLGPVHGSIPIFYERIGIKRVYRVNTYSDARCYGDLMTLQVEGLT